MIRFALLYATCLFAMLLLSCTNNSTVLEQPSNSTSPTALPPVTTELSDNNSDQIGAIIAMPSMSEARAAHTATLLQDGSVLLTGGFAHGEQPVSTVEIFDPEMNNFVPSGTMSVARQSHTATLLQNGQVLLAGGFNDDALASAELYDPTTGLFTAVAPMNEGRSGHVALLLDNGQVLLAGGVGKGWSFLATAELYDPETNTFTPTGAMSTPRESHTATRLNNGQVLITGGHQGRRTAMTIFDSAELYNPNSGTFSATGSMIIKRHKHDATLLADGRVLISGGADERDSHGVYNETEIYDPQTSVFVTAAKMNVARYKHTGTSLLLDNGEVLLTGGAMETEIYDPQTDSFRKSAASMGVARLFATATLLPGGEILFAGGYGTNISADGLAWVLKY